MIKQVIIKLIRFYQCGVSPYFAPHCRFQPTCSQYTIEAVKNFGTVKGTSLALRRICRCHPWGGSGYDPLPSQSHSEKCHGTEKQ